MPNRLADAISPYLRSHAANPVDWYGWGADAFAEARRRDVPVLVSIGYSTCHWCHVMARESFSDPVLAGYLNAHFISIKVDREEHPDVDANYLAAASAFTESLGWPLNVFVTPDGQAFHAGTYFPPLPMQGLPSFRQVLEAVTDAWASRRDEIVSSAALVGEALAETSALYAAASALPDEAMLNRMAVELATYEDTIHGGFGGAPKFPVAPVLGFLLSRPAGEPARGQVRAAERPLSQPPGSEAARGRVPDGRSLAAEAPDGRSLALRTLKRMGKSPLFDPIEGGFFRYAVRRDWSEPHFERMLYDNAQLLDLYTQAWKLTGEQWARGIAEDVARFLTTVMRLPGGGFASAQDSESTVAGKREEGGYYALGEADRLREAAPALDEKVLTGWNGLAIAALARAGFAFARDDLTRAARDAADHLLAYHRHGDGTLVRASIGGRTSTAHATLEDFGMFARGLLELALVTGEARYATAARGLIDSTLTRAADADAEVTGAPATLIDAPADDADGPAEPADLSAGPIAVPFSVPNGADPVLVAQGLSVDVDPTEGAYPSGLTAAAGAAYQLYLLTAEHRYRDAAEAAMSRIAGLAPARPLGFGAALRLMSGLAGAAEQLVIVSPDAVEAETAGLPAAARRRATGLVASVTAAQAGAFADAGFGLFADRTAREGLPTAYLCRDFVCRLPVTDPAALDGLAE